MAKPKIILHTDKVTIRGRSAGKVAKEWAKLRDSGALANETAPKLGFRITDAVGQTAIDTPSDGISIEDRKI